MTDVRGDYGAQAAMVDALRTPDPKQRRQWPYVVWTVVLVLVAAGVVVALLRDSPPEGPAHPDAWDPKVQKYVDFVQKTRGLQFEHPVYVDFLSDADFEKQVTRDEDELTDEDRAEIDQETGLLRALGMVEGDVDLFAESSQLAGTGIIGFYSYDDERLRVRGTELTPSVESTLVHELTHALQDQHFDLGSRMEQLAEADDANASAAESGFEALVEGDARRIETAWHDSLPAKEQRALDKDKSRESDQFETEAADVPEVLKTLLGAPYALGEALLAVAVQQGGDDEVDDLFRTPPTTDEQQLDPWTLVADHQGYLTVPAPELKDENKIFDDGAFGSLGWLLMLSERVPLSEALTAVDGWGGDSYAAYERGDQTCATIDYRGDTHKDLVEMKAALQRWVKAGPDGAAIVKQVDQMLVFRSCDPGTDAPKVAAGRSEDALTKAVGRTYLSLTLLKAGLAVPVARCGADRLIGEFSLAELNDPDADIDPNRVRGTIGPCVNER